MIEEARDVAVRATFLAKMYKNSGVELVRLTPCEKAKHVTITISGFMSQNDEGDSWLPFVSSQYSAHYHLKWPAHTSEHVIRSYLKVFVVSGVKNAVVLAANSAASLVSVAAQLPDLYKALSEPFKDVKLNAKKAGKLLACALACQWPFKQKTVSLVGFSLGCQVIKSCLKTLDSLGASDVVHEVTFLGGATNLMESQKWS